MICNLKTSDEHRALGTIFSGVSDFSKLDKFERGAVVVKLKIEQMRIMEREMACTSDVLQNQRIKNIAMMALWRYFVSSCKGADGLVGGKRSSLLEYSMLCAMPRAPVPINENSEFVTVVFLRLTPIDGGPIADFKSTLMKDTRPVKMNQVLATARVVRGVIKDVRFSYHCMLSLSLPH